MPDSDSVPRQPTKLRDTVSWLLGRSATIAGRILTDALDTHNANRYEYAVLLGVAEFAPISQAELARRSHIDRSDMVGTLNDLAEAGFVQRTPDDKDRRQKLVAMTDAGAERLRVITAAVDQAQSVIVNSLDAGERAELNRLLRKVVDASETEPT